MNVYPRQCPFCGGEAEIHEQPISMGNSVCVKCTVCHARSKLIQYDCNYVYYCGEQDVYISKERATNDAINMWNRRADILNRQKAEIERLESLTERLGNDVDVKLKYIYELEEQLKTAKSEAIKEFAQRLKVESICPYTDIDLRVVSVGDIDTLVKEMTEVDNG